MRRETDPELSKYTLRIFIFIDKSTTNLSTLCRLFTCVNNKSLMFQVQFLFLPPRSTQIFSNTAHGYRINCAQSLQELHMGNVWNIIREKQEHWTQYFPHGLPRNFRVQQYNFVECKNIITIKAYYALIFSSFYKIVQLNNTLISCSYLVSSHYHI